MRARLRQHFGRCLILGGLIAATAVLPSLAQDTSQRDLGRARHANPGTGRGYVFKVGVLQLDHLGRWVLSDGTPLRTDDATVWVDEARDNAPGVPIEGRSVRVMGLAGPGGLVVRHGSLRDQGEVSQALQTAPEAEPDQPAPVRPQ